MCPLMTLSISDTVFFLSAVLATVSVPQKMSIALLWRHYIFSATDVLLLNFPLDSRLKTLSLSGCVLLSAVLVTVSNGICPSLSCHSLCLSWDVSSFQLSQPLSPSECVHLSAVIDAVSFGICPLGCPSHCFCYGVSFSRLSLPLALLECVLSAVLATVSVGVRPSLSCPRHCFCRDVSSSQLS